MTSSSRLTRSQANCGRWLPRCPARVRKLTRRSATTPLPRSCSDEDTARGGFGGAPKFPPSALLEALLRHCERTGSPQVPAAVQRTATAMARGGIYDQLAGGFARYSVDNAWVVPHFEKMLYDNALLLRAYAHWARRTGDPLARRVTAETARFLLDDLRDGAMFTSSLDADADGREGSTYVWTPDQLTEVLGDDDGRWAASAFGVTTPGTFEDGASVLQRLVDARDPDRFERVRADLLAARLTRPQPGRDDKIVTAWNGLAITALAEASVALAAPELADAAADCATALTALHLVDGRLRRASLGGRVGDSAAILEDHAMLATGLLALYQLSGAAGWLATATDLLDTALAHFADRDNPGRWFDSADDGEQLLLRPADPYDGATPSGASSITEALLTAAHLTGAERYRQAAADALQAHSPLLARAPRSAGHWLAVAEAAVRGPLQIAVACSGPSSTLLADARRLAPGGAIVVGGAVDSSELLVGRDRVGGADAAYVCRGQVCDLPVTSAADLAACRLGPVSTAGRLPCRVPNRSPRPSTATSAWSATAPRMTSSSCMPTMPPSRTRSAARCTSAGRRSTASTPRWKPCSAHCELVTLRVAGHEAAFHFKLTVTAGDSRMLIEPIDVMVFGGDGKITAMKAYWSPDSVTQL